MSIDGFDEAENCFVAQIGLLGNYARIVMKTSNHWALLHFPRSHSWGRARDLGSPA